MGGRATAIRWKWEAHDGAGVTQGALLEIDAGEGQEQVGPGQVGDLGHEAHGVDGRGVRVATVAAGEDGLGGGEAAVDFGGR